MTNHLAPPSAGSVQHFVETLEFSPVPIDQFAKALAPIIQLDIDGPKLIQLQFDLEGIAEQYLLNREPAKVVDARKVKDASDQFLSRAEKLIAMLEWHEAGCYAAVPTIEIANSIDAVKQFLQDMKPPRGRPEIRPIRVALYRLVLAYGKATGEEPGVRSGSPFVEFVLEFFRWIDPRRPNDNLLATIKEAVSTTLPMLRKLELIRPLKD